MVNSGDKLPKTGKNPAKSQSQGPFPEQPPGKKPPGVAQPQVAAADTEAQIHPGPAGAGQEKRVGNEGAPGPEWPQKVIPGAQPQPQKTGP